MEKVKEYASINGGENLMPNPADSSSVEKMERVPGGDRSILTFFRVLKEEEMTARDNCQDFRYHQLVLVVRPVILSGDLFECLVRIVVGALLSQDKRQTSIAGVSNIVWRLFVCLFTFSGVRVRMHE